VPARYSLLCLKRGTRCTMTWIGRCSTSSMTEAYVRRSDIKEEKKAERFKLLMEATEKKLKLEEKKAMIEENKVKITMDAEDAKMLTLNLEALDADARMSCKPSATRCCSDRKMSWRRRTRRRWRWRRTSRRLPKRQRRHRERGGSVYWFGRAENLIFCTDIRTDILL
jgi:hypothetical protein